MINGLRDNDLLRMWAFFVETLGRKSWRNGCEGLGVRFRIQLSDEGTIPLLFRGMKSGKIFSENLCSHHLVLLLSGTAVINAEKLQVGRPDVGSQGS
jgi:hypothetical protein